MTADERDQKLIICVVQREDADQLLHALIDAGFGAVVLSSSGGFLRRGNATLLIISNSAHVDRAIDIIRDNASERTEVRDPGISLQLSEWYVPESIPVQRGGASVWVLKADLAGFVPRGDASGSSEG